MSTPFTDNPRISLLRSLEDECASRYAKSTEEVNALILETKILRIQRKALYEIAEKCVEIFIMQQELAEMRGEKFHAENNAAMAANIKAVLNSCKEPI